MLPTIAPWPTGVPCGTSTTVGTPEEAVTSRSVPSSSSDGLLYSIFNLHLPVRPDGGNP